MLEVSNRVEAEPLPGFGGGTPEMRARSPRLGGMTAEVRRSPRRGKLEQAATAVVQPSARPARGRFVALCRKGRSSRFAALPPREVGVRAVKLALCGALLATTAGAQSSDGWTIATFAGRAYVQENVPATEDRLGYPQGVAVDSAGNLFITDRNNHCIRKVDPSGIITTIAGTWAVGDGGPASEAWIDRPQGVATDAAGNLYIADTENRLIRKVDRSGVITTVAGTGELGYLSGVLEGHPATECQL